MQQLTQQFINNTWVDSHSRRRLAVTDPYRQTQIAEITAGDAADVDAAVASARAALPAWQELGGHRRADYLEAIAAALTSRREALMRISSTNNGKALAEAAIDLDDAIACYRYYATQARALEDRQGRLVDHAMEGVDARLYEDPAGVVGLITPWNFPLVTSAWKIAPALAAGCTIVFKPSEVTPLPEVAIAEIAADIKLPAGVLNLLLGDGEGIGAPLSAHQGVDKLSFTGSNVVGEKVMQAAAHGVRGVSLELGGKSPILVLDDADVDAAADWVMAGIYFNSGQICSATSRLIVHRSLAEPLYQALASRIDALTLGDPLVEGTDMGPMTSARQREAVERYLEIAREEGLTVVRDGRHRDLPAQGEFIAPTLYRDVPTDSRLWREEIFGPVLCARSVDSEAEAIALANDSAFGLAATVISADVDRAKRVGRALRAGSIWYNSEQLVMPEASWGGFGASGIGRELGPWGMSGYLEVKHLIGPAG
ncbi:aldehyde dehydrogenase family protein [Halomonas denitrificans]|uniref:aldehyde dehydrogenase family protein n=1 Tax=Halomonas TaxID=2745 RepID=UPI001A8FE4C7|nr:MULTISPECIES: aldehyde dehydrogenase family protein [Halomonas]MBN8413960.1 aldehyde dehydrogenase family protein [Halomonas litopenaei]MED5294267.1 aldehyde dehydrogenase family protein [Pseudomonadota bacterium]MBY5926838.1 aldehyde dehydrogenase family protein [Halomonas sp. DP4Y7-2]MBY5985899.1 aldehyde dehydrogenase family protein [Halomonas sp. DP5Y7-2]MBY6027972.1 aldehyde dehydrogenase family protein [Halomonas sp. DP8Y7-1]